MLTGKEEPMAIKADINKNLSRQQVSFRNFVKGIVKAITTILALGLVAFTFFFSVPGLLIYWFLGFLRKAETPIAKKLVLPFWRIIISAVAGITIGVFWINALGPSEPSGSLPSITITTESLYSVDEDKITLSGTVSPAEAQIAIRGNESQGDIVVQRDTDKFSAELDLAEGSNAFIVVADNGGKKTEKKVDIYRNSAEAIADRKATEARERAEQAAWDNSRAGQLCKSHPDWLKEECQSIADRKIWIGMSYEMLIALRGKPNNASPSNYGGATQWQWCWWRYTPSCFYDHNSDGIIDAYN